MALRTRGGGRVMRTSTELIITGRLLIMQSKQHVLRCAEHVNERDTTEARRRTVERLRAEVPEAQHRYRSTLLAIGSPDDRDYWVVAYGRLIEMGHVLTRRLRSATAALPPLERYQASTDIEVLEAIVAEWTEAMRKSMASVA